MGWACVDGCRGRKGRVGRAPPVSRLLMPWAWRLALCPCPFPRQFASLPLPPVSRTPNHPTTHANAEQKWNKAHSVTHMKANPLGGAAMAKGIVLEKM